MFKAKIENGKETLYLDLPCEQETLNAKFGGGDDEIKISFFGESEFEKKAHIADPSRESPFDHQLHLRILRELAVCR